MMDVSLLRNERNEFQETLWNKAHSIKPLSVCSTKFVINCLKVRLFCCSASTKKARQQSPRDAGLCWWLLMMLVAAPLFLTTRTCPADAVTTASGSGGRYSVPSTVYCAFTSAPALNIDLIQTVSRALRWQQCRKALWHVHSSSYHFHRTGGATTLL